MKAVSINTALNRDEAEIRATIESWAQAIKDKDIEGIMKNHADDFIMFDVPKPIQLKGSEAYRDCMQLYLDNAPTPAPFDLHELTIHCDGAVAFAHAVFQCDSGSRDKVNARLTVGLEKRNGAWVVVHEHHSFPVTPPDNESTRAFYKKWGDEEANS